MELELEVGRRLSVVAGRCGAADVTHGASATVCNEHCRGGTKGVRLKQVVKVDARGRLRAPECGRLPRLYGGHIVQLLFLALTLLHLLSTLSAA